MEINVFTDGSFSKNKNGNTKCGYGIFFPNEELPNVSEPFTLEPLTNQRAELYAIFMALTLISENINFKRINLYTDSEYSLKSLTTWIHKWESSGWIGANGKQIKNQDIIKPTYSILKKYKGMINIIHVMSHTGKIDNLSVGNDMADRLANLGANKNAVKYIPLIEKHDKKQHKKIKHKKIKQKRIKNDVVNLNTDYSKIEIIKIGKKTNVIVQ
jgi:ribonuclease HI